MSADVIAALEAEVDSLRRDLRLAWASARARQERAEAAEAMVERAFLLAEAIENEDDERWSFRYASRIRDALKGRS